MEGVFNITVLFNLLSPDTIFNNESCGVESQSAQELTGRLILVRGINTLDRFSARFSTFAKGSPPQDQISPFN